MTSNEPLFNLKAVVRQTGIKPDTLRAWERRYGLPTPRRSTGGHRLYSRRDIDTLKWLTDRQQEGLSIKRAVEQWHQIEADGRDPLQEAAASATRRTVTSPLYPAGETLEKMREDWLHACLAYNEQQATLILNQAFALYPPETVAAELLLRAAAQVGEGWYQGDVTVQQEHFCSEQIVRRLEALVMAAPPPARPGRILVACPPDEYHVIGSLLLTFLLRRRGWEVVYLGANVPAERLETTVAAVKPQLAIMAAQQLHTAATLVEAAGLLQREQVPLAYGGLIFNLVPPLRRHIAGHFLGEVLEAAPQVVESLMTAPRPVPAAERISEAYRQSLDRFQERQSLIEAHLVQELNGAGLAHNHLTVAGRELGLNIGAALALGDIQFLGTDIEWVRGLLKNHQVPDDALYDYLGAYHRVAMKQLGTESPVVDWLGELISDMHRTERNVEVL
jgi:DNA-binding transcriptional MerR regulator/methylmalonyl-CoA mutase cobalamin-binding subunit